MSASPTDLRVIIGKRPWQVRKGIGSFLLFEFGRPWRLDGNKVGTHTLWIYMAEWTIKEAGAEVAHSESPDEAIHSAADAFVGKKLESVSTTTFVAKRRLRHGVLFRFEGGYHLSAWSRRGASTSEEGEDEEEIFTLLSPDVCVSYRRDGTWGSEPGTRKK